MAYDELVNIFGAHRLNGVYVSKQLLACANFGKCGSWVVLESNLSRHYNASDSLNDDVSLRLLNDHVFLISVGYRSANGFS